VVVSSTGDPKEVGASGEDGRFVVTVPSGLPHAYLTARADGFGTDFYYLPGSDATKVEMRLVKDHPIRGRVVDTQGKPATGVSVDVTQIFVYPGDSLDLFFPAWKKRHPQSGIPNGLRHLGWTRGALFATTTDADGRFTVRGQGAERIIGLRLSGAGIADA